MTRGGPLAIQVTTDRPRIGWIGLGIMGRPMATNLRRGDEDGTQALFRVVEGLANRSAQ